VTAVHEPQSPAAVPGRLAGRVAIVTGASRGIGLGVAQRLVAEGAKVGITARKPEALAMPPPAWVAVLPVTWVWFRVTVPPAFSMAPPMSADPPVMVRFCSDRFPPGPSTSKIRKLVWFPAIVAPLPFTPIRAVTTGSPFSPLSAEVRW